MFLKFTTALLACTWGFSCAQDISGPEEDTNAPAAEEATREVPLPDGKTVPKFEPLDEHRIKIGNVIVNHKERTVSFQAQVNMKEGILEYVCCMPNGKLHESLLVTEADPLHISLGMTLLKFHRFEKFFPVRDENFEWLPFTEPKPEDYADSYVQIVMTYTENGREQKSDFSDIVVNSQTRKGLNPSDWLYTNSFFYEGAYPLGRLRKRPRQLSPLEHCRAERRGRRHRQTRRRTLGACGRRHHHQPCRLVLAPGTGIPRQIP